MRGFASTFSFGRRLALLGLILAGMMAGGAGRAFGAQPPAAELYGSEEVQALILFNFIRYTE